MRKFLYNIFLFEILRPTKTKLILFAVFVVIMIGGDIQSYVFTDGEEYSVPKPPFYDIVNVFPFWPIWMLLTMPLSLLSLIGISVSVNKFMLFGSNIIYFYILASLISYLFEKALQKPARI